MLDSRYQIDYSLLKRLEGREGIKVIRVSESGERILKEAYEVYDALVKPENRILFHTTQSYEGGEKELLWGYLDMDKYSLQVTSRLTLGIGLCSRYGYWNLGNYSNTLNETEPTEDADELIERIRDYFKFLATRKEEYNKFITDNLPYDIRYGFILSSDLCSIVPGLKFSVPQDIDRKISCPMNGPILFPRLTLRQYAHYWSIAFRAYAGEDSKKLSDLDCFARHSACFGRASHIPMSTKDVDDPDFFSSWSNANGPFHCHDVKYARILLLPENVGYGVVRLALHLTTLTKGNIENIELTLKMFDALYPDVELRSKKAFLDMIRYKDYRQIGHNISGEMMSDKELDIYLGHTLDEFDDPKVRDQIIEKTEWTPINHLYLK